ncbi:MAG: site-specific DNA-methyltransferase [bacterium]|nr:site-specific DNA-methyltransferase [bacterium]MDW8164625.1 site-specific DNA-methyltransferase [Candidatus Omnitrophota bacterium]
MRDLLNKIILGDTFKIIDDIQSNFIDLILTDPPYFLDKLDANWKHEEVQKGKFSVGIVKNLPIGMKFSSEQGKEFYKWFFEISKRFYRILKPGGWLLVFSYPRLYHRLTCAIEDAGFHIRDCFIWLYTQNQPKAFSLNHFFYEKDEKLKKLLKIYKVPKVKSCFEPIVVSQKPPEGTLLENFKKYKVGLFNTSITQGANKFPANVMTTGKVNPMIDNYFLIEKPTKQEKGEYNDHPSVKPLNLCKFLIELTTIEKAVVFDPFMGSGTTIIACILSKRNYIGIEINEHYFEIAEKRINEIKNEGIFNHTKKI